MTVAVCAAAGLHHLPDFAVVRHGLLPAVILVHHCGLFLGLEDGTAGPGTTECEVQGANLRNGVCSGASIGWKSTTYVHSEPQ